MKKLRIAVPIIILGTVLTLPLFKQWFWWNLAFFYKVGTAIEQCE